MFWCVNAAVSSKMFYIVALKDSVIARCLQKLNHSDSQAFTAELWSMYAWGKSSKASTLMFLKYVVASLKKDAQIEATYFKKHPF